MHINSILFPVDFSPPCESAAQHVLAFARKWKCRITALNVVDLPFAPTAAMSSSGVWSARISDIRKRSAEDLREFLRERLRGATVDLIVREGDPVYAIKAVAEETGSGLVMMPTRGVGPFRRYLLGSVTAKVLYDCSCPVWTSVHREQQPPVVPLSGGVVLVAIDLESESIPLLQWAAAFAHAVGASLSIVHVIPAVEEDSNNRGVVAVRKHLSAKAHERWNDIRRITGIDADLHIIGGNIARGVALHAEREHAAVIVISRSGMGQPAGGLRTQAYAIIREAPCPVIAI